MHPALAKIRDAVRGTVFEGDLFLVGGAVRDELLGLPESSDFDLVTRGPSRDLALLLFESGVSTIHPVVYERFGTAMVDVDDVKIELVTARRESYAKNSRKPSVEAGTYADDARRRDFTLNTLMRSLDDWSLVDPLGVGVADLESRILRTPCDPVRTFDDDPLRMLRAIRFRWRFGLTPAKGLYDAIYMRHGRLKIVSFERIRDEMSKILVGEHAGEALDDLMKAKIFDVVAPEFGAMRGCEQGKYHHLDVWDHTRMVVANAVRLMPGDLLLALGALLHDVGKPPTRSLDENGDIRFFGHEAVGADMARMILGRWKLPGDDIDRVCRLVKNHMRLGSSPTFSDSAARRVIRDMGEDLERLLRLVEADASALKTGVKVLDIDAIRATIARVQEETPVDKLASPLSGQEIMDLTGLAPGKEVGRLKKLLDEMVLDGQLGPEDKDRAREIVVTNVPSV
ncbi:MAG: HD domain-containing protein [Armatimonadetes bacterium]|nr:HD domain-containing protein [Armatimonadota bacterium]